MRKQAFFFPHAEDTKDVVVFVEELHHPNRVNAPKRPPPYAYLELAVYTIDTLVRSGLTGAGAHLGKCMVALWVSRA